MKKTSDGRVTAALAEMLDEGLDRIRIYPGFRCELEPFLVMTLEESQIAGIRCAETDNRSEGQMICAPLVVE